MIAAIDDHDHTDGASLNVRIFMVLIVRSVAA
jgi:hypothetical protein